MLRLLEILGSLLARVVIPTSTARFPQHLVTRELVEALPGVDIFWMGVTNLSDPVRFEEYKSEGYGNRQMWVAHPAIEWSSVPSELTSLIGSYLDSSEIRKFTRNIGGGISTRLLAKVAICFLSKTYVIFACLAFLAVFPPLPRFGDNLRGELEISDWGSLFSEDWEHLTQGEMEVLV